MINRRRIDQASRMAARWLVKTGQVSDASRPDLGAFVTRFDSATNRFAVDPEHWQTAEAIRALLKVHARTRNQPWQEAALLGGRYLESVQESGAGTAEAGSLWGPWLDGTEQLRVDSNYRCVVGLLDLYGATGSLRHLEVSRKIVDWFLARVYKGGGTHLNRYLPDQRTLGWPRSHLLDEGAFLGLYDLTREEAYAKIHEEQKQALIASFRPPASFECMLAPRMEREPSLQESEFSPRMLYWHLAPLLAAHAKKGDGKALDVLDSAADFMTGVQDSDGFLCRAYGEGWESPANGEPDGVATAMFALVWIKLWETAGSDSYLSAAEAALAWMLECQSTARREEAFGAFYQERINTGNRPQSVLGSLASSYGVLACEEYLRTEAGD